MEVLAVLPHSIGGRLTTKSIIDGFVLLGHKVTLFDELKESVDVFNNYLISRSFDLLVGYDFSPIALKTQSNVDIQTVCYFSDLIKSPQAGFGCQKYYEHLKDSSNYIFYWDKADTELLKNEIPNLFYLPHFVNVDVYKNNGVERKYDIMFAGRLDYGDRLNWFLNILKEFSDKNIAWFAINKHFEDAKSKSSEEEKLLLEKAYKGFIDEEAQMAEVLNNSKIVVNVHSQGKSAVNYRTFQAMACGCVVISDFQTEMQELFSTDRDMVIYEDNDELYKKIRLYLSDHSLFSKVSTSAVKTVNMKYSSTVGVSKILEVIK